jgi:hypothetical protein
MNPQRAVIASSASGNVTIIANTSKVFLYIWELFMETGGTANLTFYNGAGALTGPIGVTATTPPLWWEDQGGSFPRFVIDPGASFIVNDSVGVAKNGYCIYSN